MPLTIKELTEKVEAIKQQFDQKSHDMVIATNDLKEGLTKLKGLEDTIWWYKRYFQLACLVVGIGTTLIGITSYETVKTVAKEKAQEVAKQEAEKVAQEFVKDEAYKLTKEKMESHLADIQLSAKDANAAALLSSKISTDLTELKRKWDHTDFSTALIAFDSRLKHIKITPIGLMLKIIAKDDPEAPIGKVSDNLNSDN